MRTLIFLLLSTLFLLIASTTTKVQTQKSVVDADSVHTYVTSIPEPDFNLQKYLAKNIIAPQKDTTPGVVGKIVVKMIINKEGMVEEAKVVRSSNSPQYDEEALRVVKAMPKWKPATYQGKPVRSYYTLPITICIK